MSTMDIQYAIKHSITERLIRLLCMAVCLFPVQSVFAGDDSGFDFLRSEIGARPAAMAGTAAASIADLNGLSGNPASLAGLHERIAAFTYVRHVFDFQAGSAGYSQPLTSTGRIGIGIHYMNYGEFKWRDILGQETGSSVPSDWVLSAAFADSLSRRFRYGLAVKYIRSTIAEYESDAVAFSLGAIVTIPSQNLHIGMGVFNAGRCLHPFLDVRERLPLSYRVGFSKQLAHLPLLLQFDLIHFQVPGGASFGNLYWALGGEFTLSEHVFMRWGYQSRGREQQDDLGNNRYAGISFGIGMHSRAFSLDAGINQFGMLGTVSQFSITKSF